MRMEVSAWTRVRAYLQIIVGIPHLFRKYDAPQAMRMTGNVMRSCIQELLSPRALWWIRALTLVALHCVGPLLLALAAVRAWESPAIPYVLLWQVFSLAIIGLTLSLHTLGRLTLHGPARSALRPLATLPVRVALLAVLALPMALELTFQGSLIFAGAAIAAYLLVAPTLAQWLQLTLLEWGSPRRAGLRHVLTLPAVNDESLERFCAHEAGHALMYGLGEEIPEDLYLYVDRELIGDGVAGAVLAAQEFTPEQTTLEALRFRLMLLSAGAAGEMVRLGSISMSAHLDFVTFDSIAPFYLLAAGRPIIAEPISVEQHEFNSTAVARLRAEMLELATRVIEANRGLHAELTSMLIARSELAYDDVLPVLARVQAVRDAPLPIWAKSTVTHRLPRA